MRRLTRYAIAVTATATCLITAGSVSHAFEPLQPLAARDVVPPVAAHQVGASGAGDIVDTVSAIAAETAAEQTEVLAYWTVERMRAARPALRRYPKPKKFPILYDPAVPPQPAGGADAPAGPGTTDPTAVDPSIADPGLLGTSGPGAAEPDATEPGTAEPGSEAPRPTPTGPAELGVPDPATAGTGPGNTGPGGTAPGAARPRSGTLLPDTLLPGLTQPGTATDPAPAAPAPAPRAAADGGGFLWKDGGAITRTTGKVFFTLNGTDYVCSASTTRSVNRDTVLTAGHCLNNGPGDFASRWIFVPGYRDGVRPYGTWTARRLFTPAPWKDKGDVDYDIGFGVLNTLSGRHVTDVVGAQPIGFNTGRSAYTYSFGYPSVNGYNGAQLYFCRGTAKHDKYGSNHQGIPCDMTEGSSGGPWLSGFNPATGMGVMTSVNSFGYDDMPEVMFGPYLGNDARALFTTVERA